MDAKANTVKGKMMNINLNMNTFVPASDQKTYVNLNIDSNHIRPPGQRVRNRTQLKAEMPCCKCLFFQHRWTLAAPSTRSSTT